MGEVDGGPLVKGLAAGGQASALGHGEIQHDLDVAGPVTGVGKHKDGINDYFVKIADARVGMLFGCELSERRGSSIVLDDVTGGDNILKAVALGNLAAFFSFAANDEHGTIDLGHFSHGSVAADELTRLDILQELLR